MTTDRKSETHNLDWQGLSLSVTYCPNWMPALNDTGQGPLAHLEIRSDDRGPLPLLKPDTAPAFFRRAMLTLPADLSLMSGPGSTTRQRIQPGKSGNNCPCFRRGRHQLKGGGPIYGPPVSNRRYAASRWKVSSSSFVRTAARSSTACLNATVSCRLLHPLNSSRPIVASSVSWLRLVAEERPRQKNTRQGRNEEKEPSALVEKGGATVRNKDATRDRSGPA